MKKKPSTGQSERKYIKQKVFLSYTVRDVKTNKKQELIILFNEGILNEI